MSVEAANSSPPAMDPTEDVAKQVSELSIDQGGEAQKPDVPPHRSHDPKYNLKRSDPFQFGSRYLEAEDDVFEFNAWDHVETDDAYKAYAEGQLEKQRQAPASDFDKSEFTSCFFAFLLKLSMMIPNQCIVHLKQNLMTTHPSFAPI
jgi:tRNAThr (cytosine32-N3)-methyltransferase